jgi:hypothetical protein
MAGEEIYGRQNGKRDSDRRYCDFLDIRFKRVLLRDALESSREHIGDAHVSHLFHE